MCDFNFVEDETTLFDFNMHSPLFSILPLFVWLREIDDMQKLSMSMEHPSLVKVTAKWYNVV